MARLKEEITKKSSQIKTKKALFHEPLNKSIATMAELYEFLPHSPYFPDLAPSHYYLFANLKNMLIGKRNGSIEAMIIETEAYFEGSPILALHIANLIKTIRPPK